MHLPQKWNNDYTWGSTLHRYLITSDLSFGVQQAETNINLFGKDDAYS
jgi:hypothetical protein